MDLFFITGNKGKFEEARSIVHEIKQLDIDLPEAQEVDPRSVIEAKLEAAKGRVDGAFFVEDNSLILTGMSGLPGPLIKWFLKTIGNEGIFKLASVFGTKAQAKVTIGYSDHQKNEFFEGVVDGKIVAPRGENGFGWDAIFQPVGSDKTFAQMEVGEKNKFSMRRIALENLKAFLA